MLLKDIPSILTNLKISQTSAIQTLHKLIFEIQGDRNNRKRLREFAGFPFKSGSDEYNAKLTYIKTNFTLSDLVVICNILCIDYKGANDEIISRLCDHLINIEKLEVNGRGEDSEDEDSEDDDDGKEERRPQPDDVNSVTTHDNENTNQGRLVQGGNEAAIMATGPASFPINFRDVGDAVRKFSGDDDYPVQKWLDDVESLAVLVNWSGLHTFIYAKRQLIGLAKLFIESQKSISTWKDLRKALLNEFGERISSAQLHRALTERKMRKNETMQEYYLHMRELASRGSVEETAVIQYIVDGIYDDVNNKVFLYAAKDFQELKEKLRIYSDVREKRGMHQQKTKQYLDPTKTRSDRTVETKTNTRCYNCGIMGHRSINCPNKKDGVKCFRCNGFGHKSFECKNAATRNVGTKSTEENTQPRRVNLISCSVPYSKKLLIDNKEAMALIDTGSKINVLKEGFLENVKRNTVRNQSITLSGFGNSKIQTLGIIDCNIIIDNEEFSAAMHIVSDEFMDTDAIIGQDLLSQVRLIMDGNSISITRSNEQTYPDVMAIDVTPETTLNIGVNATVNQRKEIEELVFGYHPEKTKKTNVEMKIITTDDIPIYHTPRRLPFAERKIVERQVDEWLENNVIEPCASDYSSQVVLVKKKDGSSRICIDYRAINRKILKDRYPLPLIEDQLDKLQEARVFSTLDLKNGFFHVDVEPSSKRYTSFVTDSGQYQFNKVPFGLCTSPSIFQRYINDVFRALMKNGIVLPYMDDLIIPAADECEALERLKTVLSIASEYGLEVNFKKCEFLHRRVEFLGHIIEEGRIHPSPDKFKAVLHFPLPTTQKQLQSFLGLTGYFRKFIPHYSIIARPLSDLLKKNTNFRFTAVEQDAFEKLKQLLSQKPVLQIFRQGRLTELHTDASQDGYGAVLMQKSDEDGLLHPVHYMSRKTSEAERKFSSYELEVLAIVEALRKFRVYLLGSKFKIVTDCAAFTQTMRKKELSTRIARWALYLEDYNYDIEHRAGSAIRHVDALSRNPVLTIEMNDDVSIKIRRAQENDEEICTIKRVLATTPEYDG